MRVKSARKRVKEASPSPEALLGAARALERMEHEEAALYSAYKSARASGDVLSAKLSRDSWLKVSESLRKYDLLVAASRRGEGELVPRAQVEVWLNNAAGWLHFSLIGPCDNSADKAFDVSKRAFEGWICSKNHGAPVPLWVGRALFAHCCRKNPNETLLTWRRVYHIQDAMERYRDDYKKIAEHVNSAMAKDAAYLKEASL